MTQFDLSDLRDADGYMAAALVDSDSGMMLCSDGGGLDLEIAAAGNTEVLKAKRKTMKHLQLTDRIEDILITMGDHYHMIRPLETNEAVFLYVVLDRDKANLAMARITLRNYEKTLDLG